MKKIARLVLVATVALATSLAALTHASGDALNVQEGDNKDRTAQTGTGASGDGNSGQIVGAVSSGKTSVDATNSTDHADISTGDARGTNDSQAFTGQNTAFISFVDNLSADTLSIFSINLQEGDNKTDTVQLATTLSGDGIGGQVIGVVTSAGGSAAVTAANTSKDVDVSTGDARSFQAASTFTGQDFAFFQGVGAFITDLLAVGPAFNIQEGDNTTRDAQTITAKSGDGVAGQVLGVVSAGDASVDATNRSEKVDLSSGDARAVNTAATLTGQDVSFDTELIAEDILSPFFGLNIQEGDNRANTSQDATTASGDVVGGQVAGIVTSAGGSADVVLANTSTSADATSGDARFDNNDEKFVGQILSTFVFV